MSDALERFTATAATFRVGRAVVAVGVDGDGINLPAPLQFRSSAAALLVLPAPGWSDGNGADH